AAAVDPDERPLASSRATAIDDGPCCRRSQGAVICPTVCESFSDCNGSPAEGQPDRIKLLREQRSLTDEEQLAGCGIDGGCIGIEHTVRLRSVDLTYIDATGLTSARNCIVEEVPAIWQKLWKAVTALRRCESRDCRRFSARGGHTEDRTQPSAARRGSCRRCSTSPHDPEPRSRAPAQIRYQDQSA